MNPDRALELLMEELLMKHDPFGKAASSFPDHALVQRVAAALDEAVMRGRRVELRDLGFEMLVDQQQRSQGAAQITVATCHDFVDRGFTRSEAHSKTPSHCPCGITIATGPVFPLEDVNEAG
jgi:hypothetical protein